jgi:uncharacterized membrane protein YccC
MKRLFDARRRLQATFRNHKGELRLCVRVTTAALATFALSDFLQVPQVLWTVLTSVIVTQMSVGRSLKATLDYFAGTLGGAVYSGAVAALVPHSNEITFLGALALAIAPLALLAAINPSFGVAPFTAVMVLLAPMITHLGPIESAFDRVLEVALGGTTALMVSLLVLPSRAHDLAIEAAAHMLDLMARALRDLTAGCAQKLDAASLGQIQGGVGEALAQLEKIGDEARRERVTRLASEPDLRPLLRTLLRLRHDLVMIGRAVVAPLPEAVQARLAPSLERVTETAADFLKKSGFALLTPAAPSLNRVESALDDYEAEIAALRREGAMRDFAIDAVERIFGLGFALEQLHQDLRDLERCVKEYAPAPARIGRKKRAA